MTFKGKITIPISVAELMDKIAVLEIKAKKIRDPEKLKNIAHELEALRDAFDKHIPLSKELEVLLNKLRIVSMRGWNIENIKRGCESKGDFSEKFINAARRAFKNNDERAALWKKINMLMKSDIIQEKAYTKY